MANCATSQMEFSLSGLASGFDWKTFIDQIMSVQTAPINKLNVEKTTNINKNAALVDLETKLSSLQTAVTSLGTSGLFSARKAVSATTSSTWTPAAAAGTPTGSYTLAVAKLAATARREGAADLGQPLNTVDDGVGLTLATLPTAAALTAGTFTVNGKQVTIALTDTLDQVFTAIATATGTAVTASYNHITDKVTLNGGLDEVVLGAANDTSNFLTALKLANNGQTSVASMAKLGVLNTSTTLATARLDADMAALIAAGDSSFSLNGVSIAYNVNTDSLSALLTRINDSGAGVAASYDGVNDRVVLANLITGDTGITVTDPAGGLMEILGLTSGSTLVRGANAEFTLNGGGTLISASNTLDAITHGIAGLSVAVDTVSTQQVNVSGDTAGMRSVIAGFIASYNDVQNYIEENTKVTSANGKVTAALLASNYEIQRWASSLRSIAFGMVSGLSGSVNRLENLGIDFKSGTNQLEIKDGTKLDLALRDKAFDVATFFQTASTGLTAKLSAFVTIIGGSNAAWQTNFTQSNKDIDAQIATIQRRLDQQEALLTASFIAMESAQSKIQAQADALSRAFPDTTTTKK